MITRLFLTTTGLILISTLSIFSQDFKFGILAGFDISKTRLTNTPDNIGDMMTVDPMITFNVNGYVGYKSVDFWGLSLEPGYIQKGGIQTIADDKVRFQLNYIQMPVLVDIDILDKLFISVGPELSYMISAKVKSSDNSNDISDIYDNKFELSGLIGLNYSITKNVDIGIRYNHGLTYILKTTWTDEMGNDTGKDLKEYNQYFQLIVRFKI